MKQAWFRYKSDTGASLRDLAGFVVAALVALGVSGTLFHMVAPGGWLVLLFERSAAAGIAALLAFAMIGLSSWMVSDWVSLTGKNRCADVLVYSFGAAGILYLIGMLSESVD